jgi:predicted ATP-grasp superfamily ATP-dependent carboligase/O-antigen/teichoic acid export membrane protein
MSIEFAETAIGGVRRALQKSATLVMNSGALAIGNATTAGFGLVYWWLAARVFPPEVIGKASALLSLMGLFGLLGEAGLGTLLTGELARHPGKSPGLVAAAAAVGVAMAVGLALVFVFAAGRFGVSAGLIESRFEAAAFVLGCGLTVFSMVAYQALVGTLRSTDRMVHQALFSVFKLVLVGAAAAVGCASSGAILVTWVAGMVASWIVFDLLTSGGARRLVGPPDFGLLYMLRRKIFDHYVLDVSLQVPSIIMPYLVLVLLSPTTNAAFALLWMLVTMASMVPAVMALVLFPVVRASPQQFGHNVRVSLTVSLLFSLVCAVVVFVFSREILALFNPAYSEIAGASMRFLGVSLLGTTLKFHVCSLARLGDRMRKASGWFALGGLLELGFAVAGAKLGGLEGLVLGWTLAVSIEGACAALVLVFATNLVAGTMHKVPTRGPHGLEPTPEGEEIVRAGQVIPAVVIGADLGALGVCRSLAQGGVPVYVVGEKRSAPSLWSRHARSVLAKTLHDRPLIETLRRLHDRLGGQPFLVITDELAMLIISEHRAELEGLYRLSLPDHDTVLMLHDKARFHESAKRNGWPVPNGTVIRDASAVADVRSLRLPVIIKPADKRHFHEGNAPRLVVAATHEEAVSTCRCLLDRTGAVLAQETIEGPDDNIYFCLFYRSRNGATLGMFTGRKLASTPPGMGSTAFCTAAVNQELERTNEDFLDQVNYFGFGGVEYKRDARDGRFAIIEPTVGRIDWQEEVATLAGVNIPLAAYCHECGFPSPPARRVDGRVVWQASFIERIRFGARSIPPSSVVIDGYWRWDDPLPAIVHYPYDFAIAAAHALAGWWRSAPQNEASPPSNGDSCSGVRPKVSEPN